MRISFRFLCLLMFLVVTTTLVEAQATQRSRSDKKAEAKEKTEQTAAAEAEKEEEAEPETIQWAEIKLSGLLPEGPALPGLFGEISESLNSIFDRLERAAEDEDVEAIVLRINNPLVELGTVHELHTKIKEVREVCDKPVIALLETALTTDYLIATACDEIYMPESGMLIMTGLRAEVAFYKNLFEMLDIKADILRVGKFKAAAEPYTRTEMSDEFRQEISSLLDSQYEILTSMIAESRSLSQKEVKKAIDNGPHTASSALKYGLIDGAKYSDELEQMALKDSPDAEFELVARYGKKKVDLDFEGFGGMMKMMNLMMGVEPRQRRSTTPQIAVIYATGTIMPGRSSTGPFGDQAIGSESMIATIKKANENERVKAIVLRVNSPGGSALASDLIWRALEQVEKPFVVSMGDVAGSGGYYISMGADYIYAEPGTITGSIGVVGGKIALEGLFEKLGITTSYVSRGKNSGALSPMKPFSDSERDAMQRMMNEIYEQFTSKAAKGRNMPLKKLKGLAGGRIYTGVVAENNGLIDEVGTLDDAIAKAKDLAGIEAAEEIEKLMLPKPTSPFEQLFGPVDASLQQASMQKMLQEFVPAELSETVRRAMLINKLTAKEPTLYLMPYRLRIR